MRPLGFWDNAALDRRRFLEPISLLLVFALFMTAVVLNREHEFPFGDEIAFIPELARSSISDWFFRGFTDYFGTYGAWSPPASHFIRPVVHASAWSMYELCSGLSFHQFVLICVAAFCMVVYIGARLVNRIAIELGASTAAALAASWLFILNPSVINGGLTGIPFQFDVLAGVFVLAAFLFVWRQATLPSLCFLALAVFTKETALSAPLAAAISVWLVGRSPVKGAVMLLPLVIWAAAYLNAFGPGIFADEAVQSTGTRGLLLTMLRGMLIWPSGIIDVDSLHSMIAGSRNASGSRSWREATIIAAGFLNFALWLIVIAVLAKLVRPALRLLTAASAPLSAGADAPDPSVARIYAAVWLVAALVFDVLSAQEARYGGSLYPLMLIMGALVFFGRQSLFKTSRRSLVQFAAIGTVSAVFFVHGIAWTAEKLTLYRENPTRALHNALVGISSASSRVYVASAPNFFAPPQSLRIAWNLPFDPVFLYQFEGCTRARAATAVLQRNEFAASLPDCASITLYTADDRLLLPGLGGSVHREGVGDYRFPDGRVVMPSIRRPEQPIVDFGRRIVIDFDPGQAPYEVVYYDWSAGAYRPLPRSE